MDLFGRKKRQRIEELEQQLEEQREEYRETIQRLEEKAEKEKERAQEAVTEKQQADREINRLQDRIRSLEDLLGRYKEDEDTSISTKQLSIPQTENLLDNLEKLSFRSSRALTLALPPERSVLDSETGEAVFNDPYLVQIALLPPLELEEDRLLAERFDTSAIHDMIDARYLFIHISAGGSGAAFFDGQEMEDPVVVDSDVKSKHGKGGYSQSRFERRRQEQIEEHIDRLLEQSQAMLEEGFERLIVAGNREMANELVEQLETEHSFLGSRVSHIEDEDDLIDSFNAAMGWKLVRLPDSTVNEIQNKVG